MIGLPRRHLPALHELAAQVLERRGAGSAPAALARDLLAGFFDVCMRAGQDGVLVELSQAFAPLDLADGSGLSEEPRLQTGLATMLGDRARFDPGGPRSTMPAQLAACLLATLTIELHDPPDRSVAMSDELRRETVAALGKGVDVELAPAQLRAAILESARARCEPRHLAMFDKLAAKVDERGLRLPPQPKVSLDQPITHRLTPRDVAVRRATEIQVPAADPIVRSLLASLTELLELAWTAPEAAVRAYGVSQTFAVGELIEHPKFGRGTVKVATAKNVEVEFPDGTVTLVHARK